MDKKKLKVMMLVHHTLVPPEDLDSPEDPRINTFLTEFDVKSALLALGHEVKVVGADDDLTPIRDAINTWQPDIVFNLLEEFAGNPAFDYYVVSYLEMMKLPYTGCNPRGLLLARDKSLSKILFSHHHINVPKFHVFNKDRKIKLPGKLVFPMIVKPLMEEGSAGISQASYIENEQQLMERVQMIHESRQGHAIAEQYIDGRELYVTVIGNKRLTVWPFRELIFNQDNDQIIPIATSRVKWNEKYRDRWNISYEAVNKLPAELTNKISSLCKRAYRILDLNGYARFDLRLQPDGKVFMLEANPNPAIAHNEECAHSANTAGLDYEMFIQHILQLGLRAGKKSLLS
ncbi:MAG: ATP-grasp domain-containing protein [Gammaproteobacteria bacterium]